MNKKVIENFIKSGAFRLSRRNEKAVHEYLYTDHGARQSEKKYAMTGQMTLFDLVDEEQKSEFEIKLPDVGESIQKENLLAFEKEVLGIYISGHPLEEYEEKWKKVISATTLDFQPDEETGRTKVHDGEKEIIGGMITDKTVKHTKTNQMMAFVTVEDLLGTVEVVVFPRDYEKNREYLEIDNKVFIRGRVSEEDRRASKLICEKVIPLKNKEGTLDSVPRQSVLSGK